jgi:hypothetical protein
MKLNLAELANIAEIASGIAVVVTLIFLIIGIRENTDVTRASMYSRNTDALIRVRDRVAADPDIAKWYQQLFNDELVRSDLEPHQYWQLGMVISNLFSVYENAYFSRQYGALGESEWRRFDTNICLQWRRMPSDIKDVLFNTMTEEFIDYVVDLCSATP